MPCALRLVTPEELHSLCAALRNGQPPPDLERKLARLRGDDPREFYLRQQTRLLIKLLIAAARDGFCQANPHDCERLLRVVAYVRKDDDAIPDYLEHGFDDDHDLMRMTCAELGPVLERYKAWHLARRVPALWLHPEAARRELVAGV